MTGGTVSEVPVPELFAGVVGQSVALAALTAAARRPVHAYLFEGPPGAGKRAAAASFAAALLCPNGGCGSCPACRRALTGTHPDLVEFERTGAGLDMDTVRAVVARAQRRPMEADRQVLIVPDLHLAARAVPALLKTVEEPPPGTVFVLLADEHPPWLETIASRCARVRFTSVPHAALAGWLVDQGVDRAEVDAIASAAGGRVDRARLLATDPAFAERRERWRTIPSRLDGSGHTVASLVDEVLAATDAALEPLRSVHAAELEALAARAEATGVSRSSGRKEAEERHHRQERRYRTDELRAGLAVLAEEYRERARRAATATPVGGATAHELRRCLDAVEAVTAASGALGRNPNEGLLLQALFAGLSGMGAAA